MFWAIRPSTSISVLPSWILPVFNDMGKVIIGNVAHISKVYGRRPAALGSIDHPAESGIFVPLPAGLNQKVGEPAVEDGIKGIYVDLVKTPCGFAVRFKESVGIIGIAEDIDSRPVTGNELVFPVVKVFLQLAVECAEKVGEGIGSKLPTLFVKSSLGR